MKTPREKPASQSITIKIRGHLPDQYLEGFEGLEISKMSNGDTRIVGMVEDQARLFGLLIRIRDLGIPLLDIDYRNQKLNKEEIINDYKDRN